MVLYFHFSLMIFFSSFPWKMCSKGKFSSRFESVGIFLFLFWRMYFSLFSFYCQTISGKLVSSSSSFSLCVYLFVVKRPRRSNEQKNIKKLRRKFLLTMISNRPHNSFFFSIPPQRDGFSILGIEEEETVNAPWVINKHIEESHGRVFQTGPGLIGDLWVFKLSTGVVYNPY